MHVMAAVQSLHGLVAGGSAFGAVLLRQHLIANDAEFVDWLAALELPHCWEEAHNEVH